MRLIICWLCGTENPATAERCKDCGMPVERQARDHKHRFSDFPTCKDERGVIPTT